MTKKLSLTQQQYSALSDIYGPPTSVHFLLMTSEYEGNRVVLEGREEVFEELIDVIIEEIHEGFCTPTREKLLLQVCRKIDRRSVDYLFF